MNPEDQLDDRGSSIDVTRRALLERGAGAAVGITLLGGSSAQGARLLGHARGVVGARSAPVALSAAEMKTLKAVLSDLLPNDEFGPGAVEAGVDVYIDRALAGSYKSLRAAYGKFLPLFDKAAAAIGGQSFARLSGAKRQSLLSAFEAGKVTGLSDAQASAAGSGFQMLLAHMREGMFADPMYGGNRALAGWNLLGFPGVKLVWTAHDQALGTKLAPTHETAKSYGGRPFNGPASTD